MTTWNVGSRPLKVQSNSMTAIYQVDAFTKERFKGNPAAVCVTESWFDDSTMQSIAAEMNLSETAFVVHIDHNKYGIRWFTPLTEVELCGHATLASAHVLFSELDIDSDSIEFKTSARGVLKVENLGSDSYKMDFPVDQFDLCEKGYIPKLINQNVLTSYTGTDDLLIILENEDAVLRCIPDLAMMKDLEHRTVIVSSQGSRYDFVSRVFCPAVGIDEDPVTGSAHTLLTPYWSDQLNKKRMYAAQLSKRKGELICELNEDRVFLTGDAITVLKANLL